MNLKNIRHWQGHSLLIRMVNHLLAALGLLLVSLVFGISGYVIFEHLSLTDAFLNASMLLGGMGPVNMPVTTGGKIFAGFYALYSGLGIHCFGSTYFYPCTAPCFAQVSLGLIRTYSRGIKESVYSQYFVVPLRQIQLRDFAHYSANLISG